MNAKRPVYDCQCVIAEKPLCSPTCWHFAPQHRGGETVCLNCNNTGQQVRASELGGDAKYDAAFIAYARTAMPKLIAEVERLQGDVVTLKRYIMAKGALHSHEYDCDVCGDEDGDPQRAECAEGQRLRERVADAFDAAIKV